MSDYRFRTQKYVYSVWKEYAYSRYPELVGTKASYDEAANLYEECGGSSVQNDYHGDYRFYIKESWETIH